MTLTDTLRERCDTVADRLAELNTIQRERLERLRSLRTRSTDEGGDQDAGPPIATEHAPAPG